MRSVKRLTRRWREGPALAPAAGAPASGVAGLVMTSASRAEVASQGEPFPDHLGQPPGDRVGDVVLSASTITRTSDSVPDGRSSTRPGVAELGASASATAAAGRGRSRRGSCRRRGR